MVQFIRDAIRLKTPFPMEHGSLYKRIKSVFAQISESAPLATATA